jgi:hypothetical protein
MRTRHRKVTIRMTADEFCKYQVKKKESALTANAYGLKCLLNQPIIVVPNVNQILYQLKKIGNNLNQITRAANAGQAIVPTAVAELNEGVKELWQLLKRLKAAAR